jgi:hypothetical protein
MVSLVAVGTATAHHAFTFYARELTEIEGELVSVMWNNPHIHFTMKVTDDAGREVLWTLEAGALYSVQRRGVTKDLFQPGTRVKVAGRLHTREKSQIWVDNMLLADGREVLVDQGAEPRWTFDPIGYVRSQQVVDTTAQKRGIVRVWSQPIGRPISSGDPLPYREPPPLGGPEWIQRLDGYAARCEPVGMPGIMATPHPIEFVDRGATMQLLGFSNNALIDRTIYMSDQPAPPRSQWGRMGHSIGRWENENTLVVETTAIAWPYQMDSRGIRQGANVRTVERFSMSQEQSRLDYRMTVIDEEMFTAPATFIEQTYLALGENRMLPADCPR